MGPERCPYCGAELCPEQRPDCHAAAERRRLVYALASGNQTEVLRAENALLRARLDAATRKVRRRA